MSGSEVLIELAKLSASRHDERRKYEWKVSLAFWALIVGAILKKSALNLQNVQPWVGIVACILYSFIWLRGVWIANDNDKMLAFHFRDEAIKRLKNGNAELSDIPAKTSLKSLKFWLGFLLDWAMLFHVLVTGTLVFVFYLIDC